MNDPRLRHSPAAERNREVILTELQGLLAGREGGSALEIASGTGQHVVHFAGALPDWQWQPSDPDAQAVASVRAHVEAAGLPNLQMPLTLDTTEPTNWPADQIDLIYCANMIHISPWAATEGLFAGASRCLRDNGLLVTYGPYIQPDVPTAPSNLDFDASLKARNPAWGIRSLQAVSALAAEYGFSAPRVTSMPANNLLLAFTRQG